MDEPERTNSVVEQSVNTELSSASRAGIKWTDEQTELALLSLVEQGIPVREAASQLSVNLRTAYHLLARNEESLEALRGATRRLMAAQALSRIDDWRIASEVGARKKGNHAPARDWLLHAGVIDALDSDSGKVSISINIGTDDRPMRIASPLDVVVDALPDKEGA